MSTGADARLQTIYRRLSRSRECIYCQRHHDAGSFMGYIVEVLGGLFGYFYCCVQCDGNVEYDRPPGRP
jgi:hypothetical protein